MVVLGLVIFAAASVPAQTRPVVQRSACRVTPDLITGPTKTCPVYTESYHGGFWIFTASVSRQPTGTTSDPGSMPSVASVPHGFQVLPFIAQLALAEALAVPALGLMLLLSRRSRRPPVYGAVRRRRHIRFSKRRF